jgi:hypothetical protein
MSDPRNTAEDMADNFLNERRAELRIRANNTPARLFYGPGLAHWADCKVKDRSKSGAKIQAPALFQLPQDLVLLDFASGCAYEAELRWRKAELAGLWLHAAHELATLKDARFDEVKKAWDFLAPGLGYAKP